MPSVPLIRTFIQERDSSGEHPPPRYLQEANSKVYVAHPGEIAAPNCGFPICTALTQERRTELLMDLRDIIDVDIRDPTFSLNSMRQGIHLWSREISTEYSFLHRELLFLRDHDETGEAVLEIMGEPPGAQLVWSTITFGWALMRSKNDQEFHTASRIQRAIRTNILSHPRLTSNPPLWLVQTLFIVLLFARYQGTSEECGAASMFHGVLLEAVLRLDCGAEKVLNHPRRRCESATLNWIAWVEAEAVRRLIVQTFVLDVKHAFLFGGEPTMTFRDMMNLRIPSDLDGAWYAQTSGEWETAMSCVDITATPPSFIELLKEFWRPTASDPYSNSSLSGSITVMYGILSVAREVARREDSVISQRPNHQPSSLGNTVERSLVVWEQSWRTARSNSNLPWMVPSCTCVLQLAQSTLYDVSPVDLQVIAGKHVIEGKRKGPTDYSNAQRKIRLWAKEERGRKGVAGPCVPFH
ncbi:uncharacterized protein HMPREF1541_10532 [Cyphellophora europaea CBS 101466]|uniref:Xylanolytic transcriptional activator regulatory domain-containing protein n=1 Tax=Cyphellophora europaea (strain CBS 101466) TaxID=1220924 RepID=W2S6P3_CYPE1|nr:uncharacterized protein HMPREF1541_10532 [Cyphellophora europaea CBS 101466]ETN44352.1 hypothetical protein HMPREF1541_10532 [Cyphellophora europaea CBS 101466]